MSVVVSDTSPIIALAHLGLLDVLQQFHGHVLLPPAVQQELLHPLPGLPLIDASRIPYFRVQAPQNQSRVQQFSQSLDKGESEALALALEVSASTVLMDEKTGRRTALQVGLRGRLKRGQTPCVCYQFCPFSTAESMQGQGV